MPINKIVFAVIAILLCAVGCSPAPSETHSTNKPLVFSEEIQTVLDQERNKLHREMDNPVYVELLQTAGAEEKKMDPKVIQRLDEEWLQESPNDVLAQTLLHSACSEQLRAFQSSHPEFAEIFITDGQGRNVCLTNKTSDYYQADESWWVQTHTSNDPYGLHSPIEYDESSSTESISLYLPVLDPSTGNKLGILKAVLKLSHLSDGL